MADPVLRRYWDSSPFLDWIKDDPKNADTCDKILADARAGKCVILTSAVTLAEVTKRRRGPLAVGPETEATITNFFKNDYIIVVPADRVITERARRLIWDYPHLKARDAIHIATAILSGADVIEAYDDDFLQVGRDKRPNIPPIREPEWTGQLALSDARPDVPASAQEPAPAVPAPPPQPPSTAVPSEPVPPSN